MSKVLVSRDFDGIENFKDLGGIRTQDGREIKEHMLFRSGALNRATEEDVEKLQKENVKLIIDLRTKKERTMWPDPDTGITTVWNPLYMEDISRVSIFRPDETDTLANRLKALFIVHHRSDEKVGFAMDEVRQMIEKEGFDPEVYVGRMYQKFINNQIVQKQGRQFFRMLINRRDGAILWHCSAGKDRTGMITALLLYALGVSKEDIIDNYVECSKTSEESVNLLIERLFPSDVDGNEKYQKLARQIFGIKTCYIDSFFKAIENDYVSIDNYIMKAMDVHVDNIVRLKTLYLK